MTIVLLDKIFSVKPKSRWKIDYLAKLGKTTQNLSKDEHFSQNIPEFLRWRWLRLTKWVMKWGNILKRRNLFEHSSQDQERVTFDSFGMKVQCVVFVCLCENCQMREFSRISRHSNNLCEITEIPFSSRWLFSWEFDWLTCLNIVCAFSFFLGICWSLHRHSRSGRSRLAIGFPTNSSASDGLGNACCSLERAKCHSKENMAKRRLVLLCKVMYAAESKRYQTRLFINGSNSVSFLFLYPVPVVAKVR